MPYLIQAIMTQFTFKFAWNKPWIGVNEKGFYTTQHLCKKNLFYKHSDSIEKA